MTTVITGSRKIAHKNVNIILSQKHSNLNPKFVFPSRKQSAP